MPRAAAREPSIKPVGDGSAELGSQAQRPQKERTHSRTLSVIRRLLSAWVLSENSERDQDVMRRDGLQVRAPHQPAIRLPPRHGRQEIRLRLKPAKPLAQQRELALIDSVETRPTSLLLLHEPGALEHAQMPRRGRPFVRKATCNFTGGGGAAQVNRQKDLSPRRVGQRGDDGVERR
jgi:hypothetical protein